MSEFSWAVSHRQFVSAIIGLVLRNDQSGRIPLADLGYELAAIELPMIDRATRPYQLDLHLVKDRLNLSLLVDCKTWPATLKAEQVGRYMNTTGAEVIVASGITSDDPLTHQANPVFFVLSGVETALSGLIAASPSGIVDGWGMIRVQTTRFEIVHDELSDRDLSASLAEGWDLSLETLSLERLPFEPDAPRWELADAILRTIMSFFVSRRREFDVEDLCLASNELWPYLEAQHRLIRNRIRDEVRTLRRTALKGWISAEPQSSGREDRWVFARSTPGNRNVLVGFARRHQRYVSILRSNRDPTSDDFVRIDPEQLSLPLVVPETGVD